MGQQSLVSISEASHTLGVNEATLRQWTDEGKVKAFITPGGHRRYSRADLKKLISSRHRVYDIKNLLSDLENTTQLHREAARAYLSSSTWHEKLSPDYRQRVIEPGRRLLGLIVKYIAEPSHRDEIITLARDAGHEFGVTLAQLGLTLTESVEAFLVHRQPMMDIATRLARSKEAFDERVVEAITLVTQVMDEALVAMVTAHQGYCNTPANASLGDSPT